MSSSEHRGKEARRAAFVLAQERYGTPVPPSRTTLSLTYCVIDQYKPLLKEVERILAEAGLDEEEMRRGAAAGAGGKTDGISRNRR